MQHLSLCLKTGRDELFVILSGERPFNKNGALTKKIIPIRIYTKGEYTQTKAFSSSS